MNPVASAQVFAPSRLARAKLLTRIATNTAQRTRPTPVKLILQLAAGPPEVSHVPHHGARDRDKCDLGDDQPVRGHPMESAPQVER